MITILLVNMGPPLRQPGPDLAGGRPGAQPGHNFDLKSGETKQLEAPTVPRIGMPKASRWMMNREGHPSQPTRGSREVIKLYNNV